MVTHLIRFWLDYNDFLSILPVMRIICSNRRIVKKCKGAC